MGGGPIEGILQRAAVLEELGHSVEVACCDSPNSPWIAESPILIHALGPASATYRYTPRLLPWLVANVINFDGVVVNGIWQYHSYAAWRALRAAKKPYLVFTHGMLGPWFKEHYPIKHLKKSLYWLMVEQRVLSDAARVLFTCEEERLQARGCFWPYRVNEQVVGYGTKGPSGTPANIQRAAFLTLHPHLAEKRVLLFLSRIHPVKSCDLLIRAFAASVHIDPRAHLVIAGPDQVGWQSELHALARDLGIAERVSWPGILRGEDKWGAYHTCDAFVLPSHHENFGIVVAEALACGKPVLVSNKVNIWREIQGDHAGLVGDDSVEGITRMISDWLHMPEDQWETFQTNAKPCFDRHFDIAESARSLLEVLKQLPG